MEKRKNWQPILPSQTLMHDVVVMPAGYFYNCIDLLCELVELFILTHYGAQKWAPIFL